MQARPPSATRVVEVAAGVGMESELGRWIKGAGAEPGYHVHLNKGPVFGRAASHPVLL